MKSDSTDSETNALSGISRNIKLAKGRIIYMEKDHWSPEWSTTHLNKRKTVFDHDVKH